MDRRIPITVSPNRKLLLAASTGGHLAQLVRMAPGLGAHPDSLWITFDTPQSRSLLQNRRVLFVPYIRSRDVRSTVRAALLTRTRIRGERFDEAISTGAALAVAVLPVAKRAGIPTRYIESVSRVEGPSLSGRIVQTLGIDALHTQHKTWANRRWTPHWSVLEAYEVARVSSGPSAPSLFVTLGTIRGYRFDSLVDAILKSGMAGPTTVWQLGDTSREGLPGEVHTSVSASHFDGLARSADVVISHAGVGSLLNLLDAGIRPILAVRKRERGEHVDNHQMQIGRLAAERNLASVHDATDITGDLIRDATGWQVTRASDEVHA